MPIEITHVLSLHTSGVKRLSEFPRQMFMAEQLMRAAVDGTHVRFTGFTDGSVGTIVFLRD